MFGWDDTVSGWGSSAPEVLRVLIESCDDLVYASDLSGRFLIMNELAATHFGASGAEMIGLSAAECLSDIVINLSGPDLRTIESGQLLVVEATWEHDGRLRIFESFKMPYRDQGGEIAGLINVSRDITERKRLVDIMENLSTRFGSAYGTEFFNQLCSHICEVLSVEYAFIGRLVPREAKVKVIAGIGHGQLLDPFDYPLKGTPCREVIGKRACVFRSGVQQLFPEDTLLIDMGIEGYAGISLYTRTRDPLGIIVALSTAPIEDEQVAAAVMTAFSERVSAEMLRVEAEEALRQKDHDIRKAYVDLFSAVTDEKLLILTEDEIGAALGRIISGPFRLDSYAGLAGARAWLRTALFSVGIRDEGISSLVLAANEAMTNSIKYGDDCVASIHRLDEIIQIYVSDNGPGIDFSDIPKATLLAGFSTKKSLGVGFSVILEICDRVLLSTSSDGTTLILENGGRKKADTIDGILARGSV